MTRMNICKLGLWSSIAASERPDASPLAANVFERHGIRIGSDDPAFALVALTKLIAPRLMGELLEQVDHTSKPGWLSSSSRRNLDDGAQARSGPRTETVMDRYLLWN